MRAILVACLLLMPATGFPRMGEVKDLGAHATGTRDEFRQVIDMRCTVCHTRERIEAAIRRGAELKRIEKRMVEKGAVLTERDKSVLGTFWGSPLKSDSAPTAAD